MTYTVRYAHLEKVPGFIPGDRIKPEEFIGRMGSTGKSTAAHLHIDCVEGEQKKNWSLSDMEKWKIPPAHRQLNYFIDSGLFQTPLHITSYSI